MSGFGTTITIYAQELLALREARLWNWKQSRELSINLELLSDSRLISKIRERRDKHDFVVETLNKFFSIGDTAENDYIIELSGIEAPTDK